MDKQKMNELFGSDSEEEDDEVDKDEEPADATATGDDADAAGELFGEDDAEAAGDLFGSDDDDEQQASAASVPAPNSAAPVSFQLPALPRPPPDSKLFLVRLPNILAFQPRPFDPETFEEEDAAEEEEMGGEKTRPENVIRWRESRETGEKQSNARVVTWSDGSMTLHVGSEVLVAQQVSIPEGSTHLYTRHKGSNLECHGVLKQKMTLAPASRQSKTHQVLMHKIARTHTGKGKKVQVIATTEDPEGKQAKRERDYDDMRRLQARQASHRARADDYADSGPLTADFLDADEDEHQGNLGAIRAQFKNRKRGGGAGPSGRRGAGAGAHKRRPGGGGRRRNSESEDEEDDDGGEDSGEEEGDPAEMDGFIVGEGDDDDDESEAEDSEDERPAKKKKKASNKKKARLADDSDDD